MFDKSDLRAAVEGGAISDEGVKRLEAFLKARNDPDRMLDPENLRFLTNFNDVFLTIGIAILMTGLGFLSWIAASNIFGVANIFGFPGEPTEAVLNQLKLAAAFVPVVLITGAWLLAEYFCGKRRLLLPSMALSLTIVCAAAALLTVIMMPTTEREIVQRGNDMERFFFGLSYSACGAAAVAAGVIFWRFRLPFSLFLLAGSIAGLFYTMVGDLLGLDKIASGATMFTIGLATLVAAIWFDMRDPLRSSRTSDHAFWLHLAAAPQIIFGAREMIIGSGFAPAGATDAMVMLIVLVAFGVLSLALNRRALIVSGLLTFAVSLWTLVDNLGGGGGNMLNNFMLTALIVGGAIVLLGGGWRTARRGLLKLIPSQGLTGRIFPPEPA
ncbi:MAG TPA: hypothetical protein VGO52_11930 [Hyphomonadaceae bacterium]|nr:hypothetical protein [Hyphomonadaceae bacterium]